MPRGTFQCLHPCGEPLPTHASTGGPPTPAGSFDSASGGVTAPLLWSWCAQNFVYVLQDWSLFFPLSPLEVL